MGEPCKSLSVAPTNLGWRNLLPTWILQSSAYTSLRKEHRDFMQLCANKCNRIADGSLVGVYGGTRLAKAAECSDRAMWRRIAKLEPLGFLVTICRGGSIGDKNSANVYGIPVQPGALDHIRINRRKQQLVPGHDGVFRLQILEPGDQATFWCLSDLEPIKPPTTDEGGHVTLPKSDMTPMSLKGKSDMTPMSLKAKSVTLPYPYGIPLCKNHGGAGSGFSKKSTKNKEPRITNVQAKDLEQMDRLMALYPQAIKRGWASSPEDGLHVFVAKACHVRCRKNRLRTRLCG